MPMSPSAPAVIYDNAAVGAQLLGSSGDLYFTVQSGGSGYDGNVTTISINSTTIALGTGVAPNLQLTFSSTGALESVSVPC